MATIDTTSNNQQRVTVISGAGKGIGRACADNLASKGHHIIGLGRTVPAEFPGTFHQVDFADKIQVSEVCEMLTNDETINGVINNVGDPGPQLLTDIDVDTMDRVMQVNFYCATLLTQACTFSMKKQNFGRIVNISSELALGLPTRTAYGAAKAAMISAVRTWAIELASNGITANAIAPGPVETDFFNKNNPPGSAIRLQKQIKIPIGRFGDVKDVANAVSFFMSGEAEYITGQTLFVDGGSSLGATALL